MKKKCKGCHQPIRLDVSGKKLYCSYRCQKETYKKKYPPRKLTKEEMRAKALKQTYNLTYEDFDIMLKAQKGRCAICLETFIKTPNVDHCHSTNKVRALLCRHCNHMLGNSKENIDVLQRAIDYLIRYNSC